MFRYCPHTISQKKYRNTIINFGCKSYTWILCFLFTPRKELLLTASNTVWRQCLTVCPELLFIFSGIKAVIEGHTFLYVFICFISFNVFLSVLSVFMYFVCVYLFHLFLYVFKSVFAIFIGFYLSYLFYQFYLFCLFLSVFICFICFYLCYLFFFFCFFLL